MIVKTSLVSCLVSGVVMSLVAVSCGTTDDPEDAVLDYERTDAGILAPDEDDDAGAPDASGEGCEVPPCLAEPTATLCGNGIEEPGEACDDGNTSNMDGCTAACELEHLCCCGNGVLEPGEACDDGNAEDGDGCSSSCAIE